jgi:hypothetical protein
VRQELPAQLSVLNASNFWHRYGDYPPVASCARTASNVVFVYSFVSFGCGLMVERSCALLAHSPIVSQQECPRFRAG